MQGSTTDRVNQFLSDVQLVSHESFDLLMSVREIFFTADKTLVEDIKYGGLTFSLSGVLVGGVYVYKNHMSIEFSAGARFEDSDSILEGSGKNRRHLKMLKLEDITRKNAAYFICQSVNI